MTTKVSAGVLNAQATQAEVNAMTSTTVTLTPNHNKIINGTQVNASGTSVDFTSIPSGVKRITVMISGLSFTGTDEVGLQIGDSGGIETTGYNGANSVITGGVVSQGANTTSFKSRLTVGAAITREATIVLTLMNASTNTWACLGMWSSSSGGEMSFMNGSKSLSAELDRIRLTGFGGESFDAGTVNISYER